MSLIVTCSCGQKNRVSETDTEKDVLCGKCKQPLDTWAAALQAAAVTVPTAPPADLRHGAGLPANDRATLEAIAEIVFEKGVPVKEKLEAILEELQLAGIDEDEDEDENEDEDDPDEEGEGDDD